MDKTKISADSVVLEKETTLGKVPFWIISFFIILLPLFIIPVSTVGFLFSKMFLLTFAVLTSAAVSLFVAIKTGKVSIPTWRGSLLLKIVPTVTVVSAFFSIHKPSSFIGSGAEFDTAHFIVLGFALIALVAAFFQSKERIFSAYLGLLGVFSLISLFHVIRFIGGPDVLNFWGIFPSVVNNTVGGWSDLGVYAGLAVILSFITIEFVDIGKKLKWAFYAALVLGLSLLGVTNFYVAGGFMGLQIPLTLVVGIIALFVFVYIISLNYKASRKMPVASLVVLVFCIIMTIGSSTIATFVYNKIGIAPADVIDARPNIQGTLPIAQSVVTDSGWVRSLLGIGPNEFSAAWGLFRPSDINQTIFWNSDFNYGGSYILTTLVTTGILGFLAWIVFLITALWAGVRSVFVGAKDKFSVYIIVSTLLAAMYLWLIALFSVATITILTLAFFFTGLLGASLIREKIFKVKVYSWASSQKKGFVIVLGLILLLIAIIAWAFTWTQYFVASIEVNKASVLLQSPQNIPQVQSLIASAVQRAPSFDPYLRAFSQAKIIELQVALEGKETQKLDEKTEPILAQAVLAAETATKQNPTDYRNYIFLGQIYQTAGLLGVENAGDAALNAYKQAYSLIPNSPLPAYLAAYLFALAQDTESAKTSLEQSLKLKPDFKEAFDLYSQLGNANPTGKSITGDGIQTSSSPAVSTDGNKKSNTATSTAATSTANTKR